MLAGARYVEVYENHTNVATYTAADPEGKPITWSVSSSTFSIDSSGQLTFGSAPDYESDPTSYGVRVKAADPTGLYAEQAVAVAVLDIEESPPEQVITDTPGQDDAGTVLLSPSPPREEQEVTATLVDVDGVLADSTVSWTWTVAGSTVSTASGTGQTTSSYTPTATDVDQTLTVDVRYYDEEGTQEDTASETSELVVAKDAPDQSGGGATCDQSGALTLSPSTPKVGDILTATLTDVDGGLRNVNWGFGSQPVSANQALGINTRAQSNITRMESSVRVQLGWLDQPVRVLVFYDDACGAGKSLEAHSGAVQAGRPGAPGSLTATTGGIYTQVDLSWSAAADNGSAITDYQYQYRQSGTSSWSGWSSGGTGTSTTVSGLESGALYDFEVRAVNGVGTGPAVSTSSPVQARSQAKPVPLALPPVALAVQVAPNPFNPTTLLHLGLPVGGRVVLTLYNRAGQRVRRLLDEELAAGYHRILWDGRDQTGYPISSGVYLYRVQTPKQVLVGKMALIR